MYECPDGHRVHELVWSPLPGQLAVASLLLEVEAEREGKMRAIAATGPIMSRKPGKNGGSTFPSTSGRGKREAPAG